MAQHQRFFSLCLSVCPRFSSVILSARNYADVVLKYRLDKSFTMSGMYVFPAYLLLNPQYVIGLSIIINRVGFSIQPSVVFSSFQDKEDEDIPIQISVSEILSFQVLNEESSSNSLKVDGCLKMCSVLVAVPTSIKWAGTPQ